MNLTEVTEHQIIVISLVSDMDRTSEFVYIRMI